MKNTLINDSRELFANKLEVGLAFKNYIALCEHLGEERKTSNSKKAQIKEWKRYFDFEQHGQKLIITKIYDTPLPKNDGRWANNAIYVKFIELLLMYELKDRPGYQCNYTKTNLFHLLGMVNNNYLYQNRNIIRNSLTDIPNWQVNQFFMRTNQKLTNILFSALNSMKKRKLIHYRENYMIVENTNGKSNYRVANDEEIKMILSVQKSTLNENGWTQIPIYQFEKFYSMTDEMLKHLYGWDGVYKEYSIIYTKEHMAGDIPIVIGEIRKIVRDNKLALNLKIIEALDEQVSTQLKNNQEKYEEYEFEYDKWDRETFDNMINDTEAKQAPKKPFNYDRHPGYEYNQKTLTDTFVKLIKGAM